MLIQLFGLSRRTLLIPALGNTCPRRYPSIGIRHTKASKYDSRFTSIPFSFDMVAIIVGVV